MQICSCTDLSRVLKTTLISKLTLMQLLIGWTSINIQKCKAMKITHKKRQSASTPVLKLNSQILQHTDTYKYLGLLISHDLSWSNHIHTICSKSKRMLRMLYCKFYQHANLNTLLQMYISLVRPISSIMAVQCGTRMKLVISR